MLQQVQAHQAPSRPKLHVHLARSESAIVEAQRLRYRVFAEELGARLPTRTPGVDHDIFDPFCEHLIVRDQATDRVVGTYRILSPSAARRVGCYYSESEFDLTRLQLLRAGMVEIGRSCIDPDYRTGATIALLWQGLARYMADGDHRYLIGCASIGMADGGHAAANIYSRLGRFLAPIEYRVFPRHPLPVDRLYTGQPAELPALIKGYLRAGAWVGGDPAWDPDFNTADVLIMMSMARVDQRYARHFIERQAA